MAWPQLHPRQVMVYPRIERGANVPTESPAHRLAGTRESQKRADENRAAMACGLCSQPSQSNKPKNSQGLRAGDSIFGFGARLARSNRGYRGPLVGQRRDSSKPRSPCVLLVVGNVAVFDNGGHIWGDNSNGDGPGMGHFGPHRCLVLDDFRARVDCAAHRPQG